MTAWEETKKKGKRLAKRVSKFVAPFYFAFKKFKEAYEDFNQLDFWFLLLAFAIIVMLAYEEWSSKNEADELERLRNEREALQQRAEIGALILEGKLPSSQQLINAGYTEPRNSRNHSGVHMTIYAVVNGISSKIENSYLFYNQAIANKARANMYNPNHGGVIQNYDAYESFDTELYNKSLIDTIKEAERFVEQGGNTVLRADERNGEEETSERRRYLINKMRGKLNRYGYSVCRRTDDLGEATDETGETEEEEAEECCSGWEDCDDSDDDDDAVRTLHFDNIQSDDDDDVVNEGLGVIRRRRTKRSRSRRRR